MQIPKEYHEKIMNKINFPNPKIPEKKPKKSIISTNKKSVENNTKSVKFAENESLAVGTFDEVESHNYFLEALNEFRAASKKTDEKPENQEKKSEEIEKNLKFEEKKSNFFFYNTIHEDSEWKNTFIDKAIGSDNVEVFSQKNSGTCWECFGSFEEKMGVKFNAKVRKNNFFLNFSRIFLLIFIKFICFFRI